MNSYELKQEERRALFHARAAKLQRIANSMQERASSMASVIPFGQPILVGHYSEKRDRNYRGRIQRAFAKSFDLQKQAGELASRAASVGSGGISSDDPAAVDKIRERLAELKKKQEGYKAINAAIRKGVDAPMIAMGFSETTIAKLKLPDECGRVGIPAYRLQNNNANIRRLEERIKTLENKPTESSETMIGNVRMVKNAEENRLQLFFPDKPSEAIRNQLKGSGFRWSPIAGAWQRHLSSAAAYWGEQIAASVIAG